MISIKEFIDMGGTLKLPYKEHDVLEWYSDLGVSIGYSGYRNSYYVYRPSHYDLRFQTFEEAWEEFEKYRFNIGVLQTLVSRDNPDREDVEYEPEWWREAINKKADELGVPRPDCKTWDDDKEELV